MYMLADADAGAARERYLAVSLRSFGVRYKHRSAPVLLPKPNKDVANAQEANCWG
jgi:hypothetical protein